MQLVMMDLVLVSVGVLIVLLVTTIQMQLVMMEVALATMVVQLMVLPVTTI